MSRKVLEKIYDLSKKFLLCTVLLAIAYISFEVYISQRQVVLLEEDTKYGKIWVYDQNDRRCLSFLEPKTTTKFQSCMNIKNPDQIIFEAYKVMIGALHLKNKPGSILLIGLGGATIPKAIYNFFPDAKLDIVEINPAVANAASKFFDFKINSNTKLYIEDATKFAASNITSSYDVIILDAYNSEGIPEDIVADKFVKNITQKLLPDGIIIVNTSAHSDVQYKLQKLFKTHLQYELVENAHLNNIYIFSAHEIPNPQRLRENILKD